MPHIYREAIHYCKTHDVVNTLKNSLAYFGSFLSCVQFMVKIVFWLRIESYLGINVLMMRCARVCLDFDR